MDISQILADLGIAREPRRRALPGPTLFLFGLILSVSAWAWLGLTILRTLTGGQS